MMRAEWQRMGGENKNSENPPARTEFQSAGLYQNPLCHEQMSISTPEFHT